MKISLILATINRTSKLRRFFDSIIAQNYRDLEVIVADQNTDDRVARILEAYREEVPVLHLRSDRGLSKARNHGIRFATGEVIGFPDDDCWYPANIMEKISAYFESHLEVASITGRSIDLNGKNTVTRFDSIYGTVNKANVWGRITSIAFFVRRSFVDGVGGFDEGLGLGTRNASGEEVDLALRLLRNGARIEYEDWLTTYHEDPIAVIDKLAVRRAVSYGRGYGKLLRKHRYPSWFVLNGLMRPIGGLVVYALTGRIRKAVYYAGVFKGRVQGLLSD